MSFQEAARVSAPLLILAVGIGGFLVFGQRPEVPRRAPATAAALVETEAIESFDGPMTIEVEGVAVPYRQVTVSSEVTGRVVRKEAAGRAGGFVREGDFLLQIDSTDYELDVARRESELRKANEEIAAVDVDIKNSRALIALTTEDVQLRTQELDRRRKLTKSAISASELDEARRLELNARTSLQAEVNRLSALQQRRRTLEAAAELVQVQLQKAVLDQQRTRIVAPLNGTVTRDYVEEGDLVSRGEPLVLLSESTQMEIKCSLRVDQLYWLWLQNGALAAAGPSLESVFQIPNIAVEVVFDFEDQQYTWAGRLSRYEGTGLDSQTRMVPCRVQVDEPTAVRTTASEGGAAEDVKFRIPTLFSGMYVTVRVPITAPVPLLSVPRQAIRPVGDLWLVRDGELVIERVDVALAQGDRVIVRQPAGHRVRAGDQVVTSPMSHVRTGMPVTTKALLP